MTDMQVLTEKFTRRDYMLLPEGFPAELIEGDFVRRSTPSRWHQHLVVRLLVRLAAVAGPDHVIPGPADVFVDDWNALQPDVLVTAPDDPVGPETGPGAHPILVIEVLSPSTARLDRERKTGIYLRAGVREVWLVDPDAGTVEVHTPGGVERVAKDGRASSAALPGFNLAWSDLAA
jgi:Uma2 family endonuclease